MPRIIYRRQLYIIATDAAFAFWSFFSILRQQTIYLKLYSIIYRSHTFRESSKI